jgi:hypothetical protein
MERMKLLASWALGAAALFLIVVGILVTPGFALAQPNPIPAECQGCSGGCYLSDCQFINGCKTSNCTCPTTVGCAVTCWCQPWAARGVCICA